MRLTAAKRDLELETILTSFDSQYVWNYGSVKEGLRELYEKAKREQWNGSTQLDWAIDVDPEANIVPPQFDPLSEFAPAKKLTERERARLGHAQIANQLSQFLHGEQGALIVASQLVGAVPWIDGKYYAGSQTMDEARHVEVFARYVNTKLEWEWPIGDALKELLDATIRDARWDFKFLGMQVIIEGLAMAAFGSLWRTTNEPLLKQLLHYVMKDESRHVAFGVLALRDHYQEMSPGELRDREDFIVYACELMRDRLAGAEIAHAMGWEVEAVRRAVMESPTGQIFRSMLFMRIVPNLRRLGLITPKVRSAFERLQIIQFESLDPEQQDRELGLA
ncbi:ferritin-like domain-containing protein [Myxococcota bacterium]|nr:ferritin-like domain-containing protein [Myxococcota bacterium]